MKFVARDASDIYSYIMLFNRSQLYYYNFTFILLFQHGGREVPQPVDESFTRKFSDLVISKY